MAEVSGEGSGIDSRLSKCEVCQNSNARYTCPRCEVRTCSLKCVKIHKSVLECNGERDKVAYKPLSKFTNIDLLSDYRLMEEVTRSVDAYLRDPSKRFTRTKRELPFHLNRLRIAAAKRGCQLYFLPQNFERHMENTTFFDWKKNIIFWKIDWIFPQANNLIMHSERLQETEKLSRALSQFLDPNLQDNPALQFYQAAGSTGIMLLLKAEGVKKSHSRFYELDLSTSVKANLRDKFIVEYPTITVVLKDHKLMYEIIDSDAEEEKDISDVCFPGVNRSSMRALKSKESKPKNLLFDNDISNSESDEDGEKSHRAPKLKKLDIPAYDVLVKQ
ncbi:box C/D snoRNA protein 1 [Ischnura elegans]|uniref:box C/D snoRNA protein 1 n=1 Tax=Ischnura elegans TaxID=197161 RepID=UPI001ED8B35E|nr:box C/D snoRNA protein 1 [Ischnura elegans]